MSYKVERTGYYSAWIRTVSLVKLFIAVTIQGDSKLQDNIESRVFFSISVPSVEHFVLKIIISYEVDKIF